MTGHSDANLKKWLEPSDFNHHFSVIVFLSVRLFIFGQNPLYTITALILADVFRSRSSMSHSPMWMVLHILLQYALLIALLLVLCNTHCLCRINPVDTST